MMAHVEIVHMYFSLKFYTLLTQGEACKDKIDAVVQC